MFNKGSDMTVSRLRLYEEGPELSRIVQGVWRLVDRPEDATEKSVTQKIDTCLELGITSFDHADIYGDYRCEEAFGSALKTNPSLRSKMELVSKCGIMLVSSGRPAHKIKHYDTSSSHIISSVETSLKNLSTDYLDLLLIHRPDPLMDYMDTAKGLESVVKSGKVKFVGVSNFNTTQFDHLSKVLSIPLVTNQVELSVLHMDPLHDGTIGQCQVNGISPMAWSPLGGGGLFTGTDEKSTRVRDVFNRISKEQDASFDQIALSWILYHPAKILPIIGSNNVERIKSAAGSEQVRLSREDWFEIWEASAGSSVP